MELNKDQVRRILNEIFKLPKQEKMREIVYLVVTEGCSISDAERRTGSVLNTGARYVKTYHEHVKYLEELEQLGDQSN